ncbi:hypothetical protein GH975_00845 [Litorivicinus lipolyticus]|uniref:Thioredoxin domain-containing protein n=1 Tax=Litorivicinus lipolyticus TaxID=418701 RepID=A0A5Q2QA87_9GAMM|nr:hypothetical protein [Litorivicinus lipolyticus]QGG79181.1 hypothetical protein GH975_00845 [Litorivicinus lipolyticus]
MSDAVPKTGAQRRGIRNTLIQLGLIMTAVLALFFWKLNREAVVKPQGAPPGFVKLEAPKALADWPLVGQWSLGLMDDPSCAPNQCNSARVTLQRLWQSNQRLPRDEVGLVWFSPSPSERSEPFQLSQVEPDFAGLPDAGWFIEREGDAWQRWSHSLLIVNPAGELVAWVRPPFNAGQIVRSMSLAGIL